MEGRADEPVLDWAMQLAKNKDTAGNPTSAFTILDSLPDSHLLQVARDSCVVFDAAAGPPVEILSLFRANEVAQAELARARLLAEAKLAAAKVQVSPSAAPAAEKAGASSGPLASTSGGKRATPLGSAGTNPSPELIPGVTAGPTRRTRQKKLPDPSARKPYTRQARALDRGV